MWLGASRCLAGAPGNVQMKRAAGRWSSSRVRHVNSGQVVRVATFKSKGVLLETKFCCLSCFIVRLLLSFLQLESGFLKGLKTPLDCFGCNFTTVLPSTHRPVVAYALSHGDSNVGGLRKEGSRG